MIKLIRGVGRATTQLGAFDNALYHCGIHNHNLIYLSSVIPSENEVEIIERYEESERWGSKLYVVMAAAESETETNASISWLFDKETGNGLFVEHENRDNVVEENVMSMHDLAKTRGITEYDINTLTQTAKSENGEWVCAMVVAVFEEEDWYKI